MNTINHTKNFFNSTITYLFIKKNLQYLALKVFKSLMHLNPESVWYYFNENPIPNVLRKGNKVFLPPVKSFQRKYPLE